MLEIKKYPDRILRKGCKPIEEIGRKEKKLFEDMLLTMHNSCGIGLAAPQVGILHQIIVSDIGEDIIIKLANPKIIEVKGVDKMTEGCLSIPGVGVEVKRAFEVRISGLNDEGRYIEVKAKGLLARVLQHEIDHLKGKLIIDYLNIWKRKRLLKDYGRREQILF